MDRSGVLPASARIGRVQLAVSNLQTSLSFYTTVLGLAVQSRSANSAVLTAQDSADVLVELQEVAGTRPITRGSRLGLYHFAVLLPSRGALAGFVEHLRDRRVNFGSADHWVSEALYLADPDNLQIEVYADRRRSEWTFRDDEIELGADPLRLAELLAMPHERWSGAPPGTTLGHLHFYVTDLERARKFYCEALGLGVAHSSFPGVVFVSAGGYHHHVGLNTWAKGAIPVTPMDARLLSWELLLETDEQVADAKARFERAGFLDLVDPWQNRLLLRTVTQEGSRSDLEREKKVIEHDQRNASTTV